MLKTIEIEDGIIKDGWEPARVGIPKHEYIVTREGVTEEPQTFQKSVCLIVRRKPPRYVPFEKHELVEKLLGKTIKHKSGSVGIVHTVCDDGICVCGSWRVLGELLAEFTFLDGTPCGKLVE